MNEERNYREVEESIRMMKIQTSNIEKDEFIKDGIKMRINEIMKIIKELVNICKLYFFCISIKHKFHLRQLQKNNENSGIFKMIHATY